MAPKSSAEEEYISTFLQRSIVTNNRTTNSSSTSSSSTNDNTVDDEDKDTLPGETSGTILFPTTTFVSYEEYCKAKRKRNELILSGALQAVQELKNSMTISSTTNTPNKKRRNLSSPTSSTATTLRRFTRSQNKKFLRSGKEISDGTSSSNTNTTKLEKDPDDDLIALEKLIVQRQRRYRTIHSKNKGWANSIPNKASSEPQLLCTSDDNPTTTTATAMDEGWLEHMHTFLLTVPHGHGPTKKTVSNTNAERVMGKVRLLVSGEGISYHHWGHGIIFGKDNPIQIGTTDFTKLLEEAISFEERHGKDLGNGWLLRHPIEKLRLYQEYIFSSKN